MLTAIFSALLFGSLHALGAPFTPDVDTTYPYVGPAIPNADPADDTLEGNGKGYPRLYSVPAVTPPPGIHVTNNINVVSMGYLPDGMNIHFQTSFGIGGPPCVQWGKSSKALNNVAKGTTETYARTPPCSMLDPTQCSQFFHDVPITGLEAETIYYYMIPGGNGTTPSEVNSFTTGRAAGVKGEFSLVVTADMGFTNAEGTHQQLIREIESGVAFAWHGGDLVYANDMTYGMENCTSSGVCYNGTSSRVPFDSNYPEYLLPLPSGEHPTKGGPWGGDSSTIYERNWDIWQQWMNPITQFTPYMVIPGNHEASCVGTADPAGNLTTALYVEGLPAGSTAPVSNLSYWTCPETQRNFTGYSHRFRMPGPETGGRSNFWYSFDYGLAHFVSFDGETDFYQSPEAPFISAIPENSTETVPAFNKTNTMMSGPFGNINGSYKINENYEQYQWLKQDLAKVDRTKTPWIFAMSHRPMHASNSASYEVHIANAFEQLFIDNGVDVYFSGHIHYYERLYPLGPNTTVDHSAIVDDHTYRTGTGKSMSHIITGHAGNIENLSTIKKAANFSAFQDTTHFGLTKLTVYNDTHASAEMLEGGDGKMVDYVYFVKN